MASIAEASAHSGFTPTYFSELVQRKIITKQPAGKYDIDTIRMEYLKHLKSAAAGRAASGDLDLGAERARLAKEQADAKEMENAVERGELVYIEDVAKRFEQSLNKVRMKLLAVPIKTAAEVVAAVDAKEAQSIIENAVIEALNELAEVYPTSPSD